MPPRAVLRDYSEPGAWGFMPEVPEIQPKVELSNSTETKIKGQDGVRLPAASNIIDHNIV